jgi:hypothetical protein
VVGGSWIASKLLPGSPEEWHERHERELRERRERELRRREMTARGELPVGSLDLPNAPLPMRLTPELSLHEQLVIGQWMVANAR